MGCGCQKAKLNEPTYNPASSNLVIGREIDLDSGISNRRPIPTQEPVPTSSLSLAPIETPNQSSSYNILDVIKDKVTNNLIYVDAQVMKDRLALCRGCPSMTLGMCTECGCIVEFKVRYAKSNCPLTKW